MPRQGSRSFAFAVEAPWPGDCAYLYHRALFLGHRQPIRGREALRVWGRPRDCDTPKVSRTPEKKFIKQPAASNVDIQTTRASLTF